MSINIRIEPTNGLSLPGIGHLPQGEHTVDLTAADLEGAEGVAIVASAKQTSATAPASSTRPDDAALLATAIIDATATLDPDDESLWTQAPGVPTVSAIESVLGYSITAAERNAALQA